MESREALTIRFPRQLLADARSTISERESLNEFVLNAVEREVSRRRGIEAYEDILRIRAEVLARTGPQPDSGPMIRALREGEGRRD